MPVSFSDFKTVLFAEGAIILPVFLHFACLKYFCNIMILVVYINEKRQIQKHRPHGGPLSMFDCSKIYSTTPLGHFFDENQQMLKVIYCGMDGID